MNHTVERIDLGISLADAELKSYCYNKNKNCLTVRIKTWNAKIIEFVFLDLIAFLDNGGNFIMDFCRNNFKNELFKHALEKNYEQVPESIPYKLFQFLDIGNEPYLEIICEYFEFNIL